MPEIAWRALEQDGEDIPEAEKVLQARLRGEAMAPKHPVGGDGQGEDED